MGNFTLLDVTQHQDAVPDKIGFSLERYDVGVILRLLLLNAEDEVPLFFGATLKLRLNRGRLLPQFIHVLESRRQVGRAQLHGLATETECLDLFKILSQCPLQRRRTVKRLGE